MKPNHHWAIHVPDQINDYGPVYTFWSFLTEQLNKVLKDTNSNNWGQGQLEISMLREFNRSSRLDGMMQAVLNLNSGEYESARQLIKKILQGGEKDRGGTIEDAASD
ncbi:hypothetical protein C0995_016448, partial [Termitomyces sp. Mi166